MKKYLVVGIGNIGNDYAHTRHNIGFDTLDALAKASNVLFVEQRYGAIATVMLKGRQIILLKPNTFVNLSGNAVRYWMQKEKLNESQILVVADDLALPLGKLRLKGKGSAAGHNGLKNIIELIGTQDFARLRFGIGHAFSTGEQIDYVIGRFSEEEKQTVNPKIEMAVQMIESFCLAGLDITMNQFNNK